MLISLTHHFKLLSGTLPIRSVLTGWILFKRTIIIIMYMQLRAGWLVWERWVGGGGGGVGNRGSKPPYLLCLASLAPTHFLFCFWLPPCSLFSLQKIRHCCQILPLPILLVLPPLALSSPIPCCPLFLPGFHSLSFPNLSIWDTKNGWSLQS